MRKIFAVCVVCVYLHNLQQKITKSSNYPQVETYILSVECPQLLKESFICSALAGEDIIPVRKKFTIYPVLLLFCLDTKK